MTSAVDPVIREDARASAQRLTQSRDFKQVLTLIEHLLIVNMERCLSATDDTQMRRAQGATQELRELYAILSDDARHVQRRAVMRREV